MMQFQVRIEGKAGWTERKRRSDVRKYSIRKDEVLNSWREDYPRDMLRRCDSVTLTSHHCTSFTARRHHWQLSAYW